MVQISMDSTTLVSCEHCFQANRKSFSTENKSFTSVVGEDGQLHTFAAGDHPAWTSAHGHQHQV
jgi:hypothetical protein